MPPIDDEDWSDSDEEVVSEVETSVLLGTPDGAITVSADLADAAVSRIGGHPVRSTSPMYCCVEFDAFMTCPKAFLPSDEPPFYSSCCKTCSRPMELLVQMWCPFENSPMDRALYVWGCAVSDCQKKEGRYVAQFELVRVSSADHSLRAWRGLRYNDAYAIKLEKKMAKKTKATAIISEKPEPKANPFSVSRRPSIIPILDIA
jgi:pre-rRNA-processing protein TSR4